MFVLEILVGTALASLIFFYFRNYCQRCSSLPLPPGPRKRFLVGNLFDLPYRLEWETYWAWGKSLESDIIHLNVAGNDVIVLNSMKAATDLLERRSSIYSSRPRMPMVMELCGWDFNFALMPYGDKWRKCRRVFHQEFYPAASQRFRPKETRATHELLGQLLDKPDDWMAHLRRMAGKIVLSIAYGIDVASEKDPYVTLAEEAIHGLVTAAIPGTFLVDYFPILKYIPCWSPGAGFKKLARSWAEDAKNFRDRPFQVAKDHFTMGVENLSFTSSGLQRLGRSEQGSEWEEIVKCAAGSMYAAGSDTTVSLLGTFLLGMLENPAAQKRAQEELDKVLRNQRLPEFGDRDALPCVTAIVKEAMRWRNVTPIGVPHLLTQDDVYKGHRLPAGSTVIANLWSILHEEEVYPNPFAFDPSRFLTEDGKLNQDVRDPANVAFGFGRRICPGRYMAQDSIWITVASILNVFDIQKAVDQKGNIIEPCQDYRSALVFMPPAFKCSIKPRSPEAEALIRSALSENDGTGTGYNI